MPEHNLRLGRNFEGSSHCLQKALFKKRLSQNDDASCFGSQCCTTHEEMRDLPSLQNPCDGRRATSFPKLDIYNHEVRLVMRGSGDRIVLRRDDRDNVMAHPLKHRAQQDADQVVILHQHDTKRCHVR
jgi:hypothetical protein